MAEDEIDLRALDISAEDTKWTAIFKSGLVKYIRRKAELAKKKAGRGGRKTDWANSINEGFARLPENIHEDVMQTIAEIPKQLREKLRDDQGGDNVKHFRHWRRKMKFSDELIWLDYNKEYGPDCWEVLVDAINTKILPEYWDVLRLIALRMPSAAAMRLLEGESAKVDTRKKNKRDSDAGGIVNYTPEDLDNVCQGVCQGDPFPVNFALHAAEFFHCKAEVHLAAQEEYFEMRDKYTRAALNILNSVVSDHGAALLLECSSNGGTPWEGPCAIEQAVGAENYDFLADTRIQRIVSTMWWDANYMHPRLCLFENAGKPLAQLLLHPKNFYATPVGKFWVEACLFCMYTFCFSYLTIERPCLYEQMSFNEFIFWGANISYIMQEVFLLYTKGTAIYFSDIINYLDFAIVCIFSILIVIRWRASFADPVSKEECLKSVEKGESVVYITGWAISICLMWCHMAFLFVMHKTVGPLLRMMVAMATDIKNFIIVIFLFYVGFMFAFYYFVGDKVAGFYKISTAALTVFDATQGNIDWQYTFAVRVNDPDYVPLTWLNDQRRYENKYMGYLGGCGQIRQDIGKVFLGIYIIVGNIIMLNILIAMMAQTYNTVQENSVLQHAYSRSETIHKFHRADMILPPPLNLVVYIAYSPILMLKMLNCSAIKEIIQALKTSQSDDWICGFCHSENHTKDKNKVFERWIHELLSRESMDEADVPVLRATDAELCKVCYRIKKPASSLRVALEKLSYLIFWVTVLPVLFLFLSFIPSLLRGIGGFLADQVVKKEKREEEKEDSEKQKGSDDEWDSEDEEEMRHKQRMNAKADFEKDERREQEMTNIREIFKELGDVKSEEMLEKLDYVYGVLIDVQNRLQRKERRKKRAKNF